MRLVHQRAGREESLEDGFPARSRQKHRGKLLRAGPVVHTLVRQVSSAQRPNPMAAQGNALGIQTCKTPKPKSGRPCSLAKQVRTAPLGRL